MSKFQPLVTRQKKTNREERTYDVLSIQRENGNGTKNTRKTRHLKISKRKKERNTCVWLLRRLHIEGRLNEGPRLQRKHKDENKAKQNKGNTRERRHGIYLQTRHHLWLVDKGERTSTSPLALGYPLLGPSRHVRTYDCMRSPALAFSATIHFAMKCSGPCSAILSHSLSRWAAAVVHWSTLMPKALRSSRKHPIIFFLAPHIAPAPLANSPNITHFRSLVSSMRATNLANKIRLLLKVASMLSLPVLISVSR